MHICVCIVTYSYLCVNMYISILNMSNILQQSLKIPSSLMKYTIYCYYLHSVICYPMPDHLAFSLTVATGKLIHHSPYFTVA